ncbi:MAG: energy transducer TonB [Rhodothermales bacterium]|nr:energy transducer TonB [Rhodothermales bacterium]
MRLSLSLIVCLALGIAGCTSDGPYVAGAPDGWMSDGSQWWLPGTDTTEAFRDLESLESMGVSNADRVYAGGVGMQQSIQKDNLIFAVKQSLIEIIRNEPEVVDSLFEAIITPKLIKAKLSGDPSEDIKKFKRDGYRSIARHFREPRTITKLGQDVPVVYPDSLAEAGVSGSVGMQVYLNNAGEPQSIELIESVHPVLDDIAMKATTQMRWQPAYLLRGGKSDPIPAWVRFSVGFRKVSR